MPKKCEKLKFYPYFYLDRNKFYVEATNFILVGKELETIFAYLISDIGFYIFSKFYSGPQFDETGFRYKKEYMNNLFVPVLSPIDIELFKEQFSYNEINITQTDKLIEKTLIKYLCLNKEELETIKNYKISLLKQAKRY
jgi:hypothetical protein